MNAFLSPVFDNSTVLKSGKHFSLEYLSKVLGFVDTTGYRLQQPRVTPVIRTSPLRTQ